MELIEIFGLGISGLGLGFCGVWRFRKFLVVVGFGGSSSSSSRVSRHLA